MVESQKLKVESFSDSDVNVFSEPELEYSASNNKSFEDLKCWQKAIELAVVIHKAYNHTKAYHLKDQINRASVSVSNNIAEGYERGSKAEFRRFLYIAKGSCGEVRSLLLLSHRLGEINDEALENLKLRCVEISKMIGGLIRTLEN